MFFMAGLLRLFHAKENLRPSHGKKFHRAFPAGSSTTIPSFAASTFNFDFAFATSLRACFTKPSIFFVVAVGVVVEE